MQSPRKRKAVCLADGGCIDRLSNLFRKELALGETVHETEKIECIQSFYAANSTYTTCLPNSDKNTAWFLCKVMISGLSNNEPFRMSVNQFIQMFHDLVLEPFRVRTSPSYRPNNNLIKYQCTNDLYCIFQRQYRFKSKSVLPTSGFYNITGFLCKLCKTVFGCVDFRSYLRKLSWKTETNPKIEQLTKMAHACDVTLFGMLGTRCCHIPFVESMFVRSTDGTNFRIEADVQKKKISIHSSAFCCGWDVKYMRWKIPTSNHVDYYELLVFVQTREHPFVLQFKAHPFVTENFVPEDRGTHHERKYHPKTHWVLYYLCTSAREFLKRKAPFFLNEEETRNPSPEPIASMDWGALLHQFPNLLHGNQASRVLVNIFTLLPRSATGRPEKFDTVSYAHKKKIKECRHLGKMTVLCAALVLGRGRFSYTSLLVSYALYVDMQQKSYSVFAPRIKEIVRVCNNWKRNRFILHTLFCLKQAQAQHYS